MGSLKKESAIEGGKAGGPISPMLFLLGMEPLHKMFRKAQNMGILTKLSRNCDMFRMSLLKVA
jgi:hypothetical protein